MEVFKIVILALSGLLLLFVGTSRLFNPVKSYAKNSGITLAPEVDLLNEIRGASALMMLAGGVILLGTVWSVLVFTAYVVAILIFLGFALGRILSIIMDGKPNKQIIQGLAFELVFGVLNVVCLLI